MSSTVACQITLGQFECAAGWILPPPPFNLMGILFVFGCNCISLPNARPHKTSNSVGFAGQFYIIRYENRKIRGGIMKREKRKEGKWIKESCDRDEAKCLWVEWPFFLFGCCKSCSLGRCVPTMPVNRSSNQSRTKVSRPFTALYINTSVLQPWTTCWSMQYLWYIGIIVSAGKVREWKHPGLQQWDLLFDKKMYQKMKWYIFLKK